MAEGFTFPEKIADLPELDHFVDTLVEAVSKLPDLPAPVTGEEHSMVFAAVMPALGALVDILHKQLQAPPAGPSKPK